MLASRRSAGPLLALVLLAQAPAFAQGRPLPPRFESQQRPGEIRPKLPEPGAPEAPGFVLPAVPPPSEAEGRLSHGPQIVVHEFHVTGSTIFSEEALARVTAPYVGRQIASEQLLELRDRLTHLYVDAGYLNSGAVLPDQDIREGVVEYQIVEGRLAQVEIEGNRWFRSHYLESRILRGAHTPLDVKDLEKEIQLLQQDPRIRRVNAELVPGERPGDARLRAHFEEELPFTASLELSNYQSPSVGAYGGQLDVADRNLTGNGDVLRTMTALTEGLQEYEVGYEIPVTSFDTTVGAWFYYGTSDVIEQPFEDLDISSRSETIGLELRQPLYRTLESQLAVALTGEWRVSKNFLLGDPFSFSEGPDEGRTVVSVIRFRQDYLYRDLRQVVALRSQLSVGIDALGATMNGCVFAVVAEGCSEGDGGATNPPGVDRSGVPDAQFVSWLGQLQWVRRFEPFGIEGVFRTDVQLASQPLFSLEQFSVGGHQSVRGYRENELVRDNGWVSSLELRLPLWRDSTETRWLQLAPFFDIGRSWNTDRGEESPRTLESYGVGLRAAFSRHLNGQIYWGHRVHDVPQPEDHDLQDDGVQFSLTTSF